jgi:hypothetical protein
MAISVVIAVFVSVLVVLYMITVDRFVRRAA